MKPQRTVISRPPLSSCGSAAPGGRTPAAGSSDSPGPPEGEGKVLEEARVFGASRSSFVPVECEVRRCAPAFKETDVSSDI